MRGTACVMPLSPSDVFPPPTLVGRGSEQVIPWGVTLGDILFLKFSLYKHETNNCNTQFNGFFRDVYKQPYRCI